MEAGDRCVFDVQFLFALFGALLIGFEVTYIARDPAA